MGVGHCRSQFIQRPPKIRLVGEIATKLAGRGSFLIANRSGR